VRDSIGRSASSTASSVQLAFRALAQRRQHYGRRACVAQHQGMREVVDVFRGAGKVDEFETLHHFGVAGQLVFQEVFDGLDVVIGGFLMRLHRFCVGQREVG
jgi:hypothetical protein